MALLLITTANSPPRGIPFLQMTNPATRSVTAKAAVFFWAALGIEKIVIADATDGTLLSLDDIGNLTRMGVEIEQIAYQQDNSLVTLKGKGFAEGQLIKFALDNSELMRGEDNFFKCTGKFYCRNFEVINQLIKQENLQNIFWQFFSENLTPYRWVDLRFFYASKKFCSEHLIPAYLMGDDSKNTASEFFCFNRISEELTAAKTIRPLMSGFGGFNNQLSFDLSLGALDFQYPSWFGK